MPKKQPQRGWNYQMGLEQPKRNPVFGIVVARSTTPSKKQF